jgi:uncharacterized membrane protein
MFNFLFTKTPLMFLVQSLWRDEAYSYLLAKRNIFEIITLTMKDFSPPLYYLVLHYWTALFGKSEIALRSLSLIFFWATLYVVYLILSEVFKLSVRKSFLYLLFFLLNPILVYFAFEARMYSLFAFLSTLSFYSLYKKNKKLYLLSTILGLYTHYFMVFVVIGQWLVARYKQKQALLAFAPWMILVLVNRATSSGAFWIGKISIANFLTFLGEIFTGYEKGFGFFGKQIVYVSLAILAVVIFAYFKNRQAKKADKDLYALLFVWGVGIPLFVLLISFFKPVFLPRYLIFSSVGLSLLMVYSFEKMPIYLKVFAIAFLVAFSFNFQKMQVAKRTKAPLRQTVNEINSMMKDGDSVYVASELDYFTVQYYLNNNRIYIYGKSYEEIPDYIGKVLVEKDRVTTNLPIYPNKAFVVNADGSYDIKALY